MMEGEKCAYCGAPFAWKKCAQRTAEIRAMRLVVDALELKMKRMLEAGSVPGTASVLDELLSVAATEEQLLALLDESENR